MAVDLQPRGLSRLEHRVRGEALRNVRLVLGDLGDLPAGQLSPAWFDRAFLVTMLGEFANQAAALRSIYDTLKPGGILSVTEVLPDPHFQPLGTVRRLAAESGSRVLRCGLPLAYTINLIKDDGRAA